MKKVIPISSRLGESPAPQNLREQIDMAVTRFVEDGMLEELKKGSAIIMTKEHRKLMNLEADEDHFEKATPAQKLINWIESIHESKGRNENVDKFGLTHNLKLMGYPESLSEYFGFLFPEKTKETSELIATAS